MNEALRRQVYGDLIDAIARRCPEHEDPAKLREDVDRMARLASADDRLQHKYHDRLITLWGKELDDGSLTFLSQRIEALGLIKPRALDAAPAPASTPSVLREDALATVSALAGKDAPALGQSLFEPASQIRTRGSGAGWAELPPEQAAMLFGLIHPIDGRHRTDIATTQAWVGCLPFYSSTVILRVMDPTWAERDLVVYYLLRDQGRLFRLNGQSPNIHEVNAADPITIDRSNALDYLRFFCFFVHGEEGCFYIAETLDDPMMPTAFDTATQETLSKAVRPAQLNDSENSDGIDATATVFYSNALFTGSFRIQPSGMVEMLDDEPLAGDLPVRVINRLQ